MVLGEPYSTVTASCAILNVIHCTLFVAYDLKILKLSFASIIMATPPMPLWRCFFGIVLQYASSMSVMSVCWSLRQISAMKRMSTVSGRCRIAARILQSPRTFAHARVFVLDATFSFTIVAGGGLGALRATVKVFSLVSAVLLREMDVSGHGPVW